jgi:hypothetical protein
LTSRFSAQLLHPPFRRGRPRTDSQHYIREMK